MKNKILFLAILIVMTASLFYNFYSYSKIKFEKNNSNELLREKEEFTSINNKLSNQSTRVNIKYNASTNELYAVDMPDLAHTCVWTILGDHGSDTVVITRSGDVYTMNSYDYFGHVLSNEIEVIKTNRFLPPRVPIYMTCIDWSNKTYYGEIGE